MRKLIVRYDGETTAQTVAIQDAASVSGVTATLPIDLIPAVIVDVKPGQVNAVERRLRQQRSVTRVERPKQAFPHVMDPQYLNGFFTRVDRERGYQLPLAGSQTRTEVVTRAAEIQQEVQRRQQNNPTPTQEISSVDDAYEYIGADSEAVDTSNVIAANLDEGVHPSQFASDRQLSGFSPTDAGAYEPSGGHGSYTMGVLAGGQQTSGIDKAPLSDSDIYPQRVNFGGADMLACLDDMERLRQSADRPIIYNNSWGYGICNGRCATSVNEAYTALAAKPGIVVVASAGNDARKCGQSCTGTGNNGIASFRTAKNIVSVALSGGGGDTREMINYSSRGPGGCNDTLEPTTIAPLFGAVPYGDGSDYLGGSVGTSGSSPMVAAVIGQGIAAAGHDVSTEDIIDAIKTTGTQWKGSGHSICTGWGEIDGQATPQAIAEKPPDEGQSATARFSPDEEPPFTAGEGYTFDAGSSVPVSGSIEDYEWSVTNGRFEGQNDELALVTPTAEGTLGITLTVTDSGGFTGTTTKKYQTEALNEPPTAKVRVSPLEVTPPATVTFDATDSSDPDGTIQRFDWEFSDGQTARGVAVQRSVSESDVGTLTGTVTVTDADGASDSVSGDVQVKPQNESPVAKVRVDQKTVTPPATVTFDATDSSDPDGTIQRFDWEFSDGQTARGVAVQRSVSESDVGTLTGTVTVTDADGASDSATETVTVEGDSGSGPTARVSVRPESITPPGNVTFDGSGSSDPDGEIRSYQWAFSDGETRVGAVVTRRISAGDADLRGELVVKDSDNRTDTDSETVAVTDAPENDPPTARISLSKDRVSPPETIRLQGGESTDPDGEIVAYQWVIGDVATATGEVVEAEIPEGSGDSVSITLTVTDADGATDTETATITIEDESNNGIITDEAIAQGVMIASGLAASVTFTE